MIAVLLEREKSRPLLPEIPAMKISDLGLKIPVSESCNIARYEGKVDGKMTKFVNLELLIVYEFEGKIVHAGWEVVDRNDGEPAHTYISDPACSAILVTYLPADWDGSPFLAKQSCEYKNRWDEDWTDQEWEKEKKYILECGEGDYVPAADGDWKIYLGTPEEVEKWEADEEERRIQWEKNYMEANKKGISELAVLMTQESEGSGVTNN
jgi:hypothetical protein